MAILQQTSNSSPDIDPADFTTQIDNSYMILRPGTVFTYEDKGEGTVDTFSVTWQTAVIDGVTCVVVHDQATVNGQLVEDTFDYFAQDLQGNVWYFGEDTKQFKPGNPHPIGTTGSWLAGVDGAQPGIIMEAQPHVGDTYLQENAPGIAEDTATVLGLNESVFTEYGFSDHALKTKEFTPLAPGDIENKYYIPGVGEVLTTTADGEYEQLVKITVNGLSGDDTLLGYAGGDEINGRAGNDTLWGLDGNDTLYGNCGDDNLIGGRGNDDLDGGSGDNSSTGGAGADIFMFHNLRNGIAEVNTITDYRKGQTDVIDLPQAAKSIASENLQNGVWQLTLKGDGDVIILAGVTDSNHDGHIIDDLLII